MYAPGSMEWLADAGTRHVVRGRMGVNWRIWGGGAANPFRVCGGACRPIGKPPSVGERAEPGSSVTRRWREMDSNFLYRGTKAVDFRSIAGDRRGS